MPLIVARVPKEVKEILSEVSITEKTPVSELIRLGIEYVLIRKLGLLRYVTAICTNKPGLATVPEGVRIIASGARVMKDALGRVDAVAEVVVEVQGKKITLRYRCT